MSTRSRRLPLFVVGIVLALGEPSVGLAAQQGTETVQPNPQPVPGDPAFDYNQNLQDRMASERRRALESSRDLGLPEDARTDALTARARELRDLEAEYFRERQELIETRERASSVNWGGQIPPEVKRAADEAEERLHTIEQEWARTRDRKLAEAPALAVEGSNGISTWRIISEPPRDPRGEPYGETAYEGLLLARDHASLMYDQFADQLDGLGELGLADKRALTDELTAKARELSDLETEYLEKRSSLQYEIMEPYGWDGEAPLSVKLEAEEAEKELESLEGEWQRTMTGFLTDNPLLAVEADGTPLWRALSEPHAGETALENQLNRMYTLEEHLNAGAVTFRDRAIETRQVVSSEELVEFGGPKYATVRTGVRMSYGADVGSTLPDQYMDAAEGVYEQYAPQQAVDDAWTDFWISIVGVALIPLGPAICMGYGALELVKEGAEWRVAYLTAEEAEATEAVTGHRYTITARDRARAAAGEVVFTAVTVGIDAAEVARMAKTARAAGAADECVAPARAAGPAAEDVAVARPTTGGEARPRTGDPDPDAVRPADSEGRWETPDGRPATQEDYNRFMDEAATEALEGQRRAAIEAGVPTERVDEVVGRVTGESSTVSKRRAARELYRETLRAEGKQFVEGAAPEHFQRLQQAYTFAAANGGRLHPDDLRWLRERVAEDPAFLDELSDRGYLREFGGEYRRPNPVTGETEWAVNAGEEAFVPMLPERAGTELRGWFQAGEVVEDAAPRVATGGRAADAPSGPPPGSWDEGDTVIGGVEPRPVTEPPGRPTTGDGPAGERPPEDAPRVRSTGPLARAAKTGLEGGKKTAQDQAKSAIGDEGGEEKEPEALEADAPSETLTDPARPTTGEETEPQVGQAPGAGGSDEAIATGGGFMAPEIPSIRFAIRPYPESETGEEDSGNDPDAVDSDRRVLTQNVINSVTPPEVRSGSGDPTLQLLIVDAPSSITISPSNAKTSMRLVPGGAVILDPDLLLHAVSEGGLGDGAMRILGFNGGNLPISVEGGSIVLEPVDLEEEVRRRILERIHDLAGENPWTRTLDTYCLQLARGIPDAGTVFRIASQDLQQRFAPLRSVLDASRRLQESGLLNPDSDTEGYFHSIRQWAIWTLEEELGVEEFTDAFLEHTKKNVAQTGADWTSDVEKGVRSLIPNRWKDVVRVLEEAGARTPARPSDSTVEGGTR